MLNETFLSRLEAIVPVLRDEPMARHTTLNVGGPAAAYVSATDACALRDVLRLAREAEAPVFIMGAGSNLLVSDAGIDALAVHTWANSQTLDIDEDTTAAWVYAGAPLPRIAYQAAAWGLSGLEWSVGVPGTVGGGVVNNAGAHGSDMASILRAVRIFDGQEERVLKKDDLGYGYRVSNFRSAWADAPPVVLEAEIEVRPDDKSAIKKRIEEYVTHRRTTQPSQRSVGSIFKNPPDKAAGKLIEEAGLKGRRAGDAEISTKHGNFIVNRGQARAGDVYELVTLIRETVKTAFGIDLELEIQPVGFSNA